YGTGESVIAERIVDWEEALPAHIKLAYLPSFGRVRLRLSAKGKHREVLEQEIEQKIIELNEYIADITLGLEEGDSIEKSVGRLLKVNNKTLCTAESMTGGKIASTMVSVPGSSAYYKGSLVTYTAELKQELLGVSEETINKYSVVSAEVAKEMVEGAIKNLKTDYSIAVTGNAGPTTDNNDMDIGVVYIAIANGNKVDVKKFDFGQPREKVINRTVTKALELLQRNIIEN
ncbi:MAG TPA: damage-inducible protein CinA, partial [Tenacibaculum sp.]|nr:damage-inducible protein CinA [Tenacibaculum sp.]